MENRKQLFGIISTSLFILLMFSGCTQQNDQIDDHAYDELVQTILEKTENIGSLYYEMTSSTMISNKSSQMPPMKIWEKGPFVKEERNVSLGNKTNRISIIKRPEGIYYLEPIVNTTKYQYVLSLHTALPQAPMQNFIQDLLDNQTLKYMGKDTLDGKNVTVIQYTKGPSEFPTTVKISLWNETGLPLKITSTSTTVQTTVVTTTYTNYSFADISDDVFSIEYCNDCNG